MRKSASLLCASHLGTDLVRDPAFLDPMVQYETLFTEYFELYCSTLMPREDPNAESEPALLPLLKHQLNEWRWVILNPKQALPHLQRESELRRPAGDTQKMRLLKFPKSGRVRARRGFPYMRFTIIMRALPRNIQAPNNC